MGETYEGTVLVVDDAAANIRVLIDALSRHGYRILVALNGSDAMTQSELAVPDLVLLDILLPDIDGFETCRRLKQNPATRDIPVIFITALADVDDKVRGFEAGGIDYITKPIRHAELLARVSTHVRLRRLQEQLRQTNESLEQRNAERTAEIGRTNERLRTEISECRRLEQKLVQNQKLETINTFAGGISHDFKNLLTGINGNAEVLQRRLATGSRERIYVDRILAAGERASQLVQQIMMFSRETPRKQEIINVQDVLSEVLSLLQPSIPDNVTVHTRYDDAAGTVQGDSTQIYQIALNLCSNALRSMSATGGTLELSVTGKVVAENRSDEVEPGTYVTFAISDTGVGINADVLPRIFDPFFTTCKNHDGTGLGLAVVHGIVKGHNGEIVVDSEVDRGSTFKVYLPRTPASPEVVDL